MQSIEWCCQDLKPYNFYLLSSLSVLFLYLDDSAVTLRQTLLLEGYRHASLQFLYISELLIVEGSLPKLIIQRVKVVNS